MNQSASAMSLVSQKPGSKPQSDKKSPVDQHSIRRVSVRHQKRQLLLIKLAQFPTGFLMLHCFILAVLAAIYIGTQIAIIVKRTPLFYLCTGFWMGLLYFACIYTVFLLVKNQTYKSLVIAMTLQAAGLALTIIGTILINAADAALFVQVCIPKCLNQFSYQFLNILMVVAGVIGFFQFCLFFLLVELKVLREPRRLNMYLQNRN